MSVLDYEYGDCLLTDSCTDSECVDIPTQDPPETTGQLG